MSGSRVRPPDWRASRLLAELLPGYTGTPVKSLADNAKGPNIGVFTLALILWPLRTENCFVDLLHSLVTASVMEASLAYETANLPSLILGPQPFGQCEPSLGWGRFNY